MKALVVALLLTSPLFAQEEERSHPIDITIKSPDGGFRLAGTICRYSSFRKQMVTDFEGTIVALKSSWIQARFTIELKGGSSRETFPFSVEDLSPAKPTKLKWGLITIADHFPGCAIDSVEVRFVDGNSKAEAQRASAAEAEERRKIRASCAAIYQSTANKKLGDLTVKEEQQVRACQSLGLYPPS